MLSSAADYIAVVFLLFKIAQVCLNFQSEFIYAFERGQHLMR
jgi:hypothetical protein